MAKPVYEDVLLEVAFLSESPVADVTDEKAVARVNPQMLSQ